MAKERSCVYISPIGMQDPWSGWKNKNNTDIIDIKTLEKAGNHYGPALRGIEVLKKSVRKAVFVITDDIEKSGRYLKITEELSKIDKDIEVIPLYTKIVRAHNYDEIHDKLLPLLKEVKQALLSDHQCYLNQSPGTPQINLYLNTLFLMGFFRESYKDCKPVQVYDPKHDANHSVKVFDKSTSSIARLYNGNIIATLIKSYEYHAALKIANKSSYVEIVKDLQSLDNCINIYHKYSADNLPEFTPRHIRELATDSEVIKCALAYWSAIKRLEANDLYDACIRMAILVEGISLLKVKKDNMLSGLIEESNEGFNILKIENLSDKCKNELEAIQKKKYKERYILKAELKLSGSDLEDIINVRFPEISGVVNKFSKIRILRNKFVHDLSYTVGDEDKRFLGNVQKHKTNLVKLMNLCFPEHEALWEGENFFDICNKELLKKYDLDWLL